MHGMPTLYACFYNQRYTKLPCGVKDDTIFSAIMKKKSTT